MRLLRGMYQPVLRWALRHRAVTLCAALALFLAAVYTATTIGSEFMPPLDEETALFMPITDPRNLADQGDGDSSPTGRHHRRRSCRGDGCGQGWPG